MINKKLARKLIDLGLETGADFVELYVEDTTSSSINFEKGIVESVGYNSSIGCGIRLLKENKSIYGFTNELKEKTLVNLMLKLRDGFHDKKIVESQNFVDKKFKHFNKVVDSYFDTPMEKKIEILKTVHDYSKNYSPLVNRAVVSLLASKKLVHIYNSKGMHTKDNREYNRLMLKVFIADKEKREHNFDAHGELGGLAFINKMDLKKFAEECTKDTIGMLTALPCPSGKMPVIIGNGTGGVLFHEACGHSLEATALARDMSNFSNRMGDKIASDIVTAYDDGTIPNAWGSGDIDDEGNLTQKNCLIKNGILTGYLIDSFNGRKLKMEPTGCARRQNYKREPTSRMSNTYIDKGSSTVDEIIKNTKLGLYCKSFGGGSVSPVTGEFEFVCNVAFIVRDGEIKEQVKGASIIGTSEEVLKNIDMIADDLELDTGYCGSASGWVPVRTGQPTLRIKEMLVGGSGGKLV